MPCPICAGCEGAYPGPARVGITLEDDPMPFTSDKRLWLDQDGKVTDEPPSSGRLLVNEGGELSDEDAKLYGLTKKDLRAAVAEDEEPAKPDAKQVAAPPENKAQTMEKSKDK
jgi:hypothetical protein